MDQRICTRGKFFTADMNGGHRVVLRNYGSDSAAIRTKP